MKLDGEASSSVSEEHTVSSQHIDAGTSTVALSNFCSYSLLLVHILVTVNFVPRRPVNDL